jgi:hypothetical protein
MQAVLEALDNRQLRTVAERWWTCRLDADVPHWRHMPRAVLQPLMPAVLLLHHVPEDESFRVETLTDDLTGLTRLRLGGKLIEDVLPGDMVPEVRDRLLSVLHGPAVIVIKVGDQADPGRGAVEERLLLPLRDTGRGKPDLLLAVYTRLDAHAAHWLPITQNALAITRFPLSELVAQARV